MLSFFLEVVATVALMSLVGICGLIVVEAYLTWRAKGRNDYHYDWSDEIDGEDGDRLW